MNKIQKIALLLTYHSQVEPLDETVLMLLIAWVVNGVDEQPAKDGIPRINWQKYVEFAEHIQQEMNERATDVETT